MNLSPPSPAAALKILIVDCDAESRLMLAVLAGRLGHRITVADSGESAVNAFCADAPDVVLMARLKHGMDCKQAMAEIRASAGARWVPILFVVPSGHVDLQAQALAHGADDCLVKPVHEAVLGAKLAAAARTLGLNREIEHINGKLQGYHDAAAEEMRVVKHMLGRLVHQDHLSDPMLEHWILPATTFSGDLVTAARTPRGVLHVMLADGAGHGLAAALNVLPIVPCFYTMTGKGLDIELIAATVNRTIRQQMPIDRFVAATLIAVDYAARRVKVWNGGNPPLLALDAGGAVIARFRSRNLALGLMAPAAFAPVVDVFDYTAPCQLFAYSDGVVESYDAPGAPAGQGEVEALLTGVPPKVRMKVLRNRLAARHVEQRAHDDMTMVLVQCGGDAATITPAGARATAGDAPSAPVRKFELTLTPPELREIDVVPMLLDLIATIPAARPHRRELCVVLSELYSNALEHGVLGLKSSLKEGAGGLDRYADARAAALIGLTAGSIAVAIESHIDGGRPVLAIRFRDSGAGFDFAALPAAPAAPDARPYGRGIAMLRALCASVEYRGCGSEVSVCFALDALRAAIPRAA